MSSIVALDVGDARIGVAIADSTVRFPRPLITLANDESFVPKLQDIITGEQVEHLVIGTPRDINGNETEQTRRTAAFVDSLTSILSVPVTTQDEALTSQQAEKELEAANKPFTKGDIDALAACYILQDYLQEHAS